MISVKFVYIVLGVLFLAAAAFLGSNLNALFVLSPSGSGNLSEGTTQISAVKLSIYYFDTELHYNISATPNTTAFDVLDSVAEVAYDEYDYGKFITSINNVSQDEGHYWLFFINSNLPSISADSYVLQDGDHVEFRYLDSETAMGYFPE